MPSFRPLLLPLLSVTLGVALEVVLLVSWRAGNPAPIEGPTALEEVQSLAQRQGLYARSDHTNGVLTNRLVVSDRPLTLHEAASIRFGDMRHPSWAGVVAVCYPARNYLVHHEPENTVLWGKMFLIGDHEVIRRLTRRRN
jgi:hypothetical protein